MGVEPCEQCLWGSWGAEMFGIFYWCTSTILSIFPSYMYIVMLKISVTEKATSKCSFFPCMRGRVQKWTPSPWTTPVDLVRGPLHGPSPWTTLVEPPIHWRWILPVGLNMIWIIMSVKEGIIPQKQSLLSVYIIRLMSFSYYTPVQFFLEFYTWIWCSLVKDEQYLCSGGSSLLCKRFISSRCTSSPEFPSVDGPWKRFFIRRLKSLLLMDQTQNGLHITFMSRTLAKCLSNHIVWKYAGHFVFVL